jgi:hypothetical protein
MIVNDATPADTTARELPSDSERMIARWRELGCPYIELDAGVVISNLERWLYNNPPHAGLWLARVREYLYIDTLGIDTLGIGTRVA